MQMINAKTFETCDGRKAPVERMSSVIMYKQAGTFWWLKVRIYQKYLSSTLRIICQCHGRLMQDKWYRSLWIFDVRFLNMLNVHSNEIICQKFS